MKQTINLIGCKLTEVQSIDHFITYSVISAQPELSYSSVVSTIRVYPVTSGKHEGQTFITWTGNFSSDADASTFNKSFFNPHMLTILQV